MNVNNSVYKQVEKEFRAVNAGIFDYKNMAFRQELFVRLAKHYGAETIDIAIKYKPSVELMTVFEGFASNIDELDKKSITIFGASGVGKTTATMFLAEKLVENGHQVLMMTSENVQKIFLTYHTTFDNNKEDILMCLNESEILVIDDVGVERIFKNVSKEYLLSLLKLRKEKCLSTIVNTCLTPSEFLTKYDEPIFSRIVDKEYVYVFNIEGENLRIG